MSQVPNYVVRQDSGGGELKLLLIRDPRAAHAAAKISPLKKASSSSLSSPAASRTPSAPSITSFATQQATKSPQKRRPAAISISSGISTSTSVTTSSASSSGGVSALSPTSLTQAANEAMALANLVRSAQDAGAAPAAGKKAGDGRVKGGRIVKLQQTKTTPTIVPKKPPKSSTGSAHPHGSAKPRPQSPLSTAVVLKPAQRSVPVPKHQSLLPLSRVRTIMRTDVHSTHSTQVVSQDSVALVTKATELFIVQLAKEAHKVAVADARRDVSYGHLAKSIRKTGQTTFLHDVIPEKVLVSDYLASLGNQPDHTHDLSKSSSSDVSH